MKKIWDDEKKIKMSDLDKLILTKLKKFIKLCKHKRSSDGQWYFKDPSPKTINSIKSDKYSNEYP